MIAHRNQPEVAFLDVCAGAHDDQLVPIVAVEAFRLPEQQLLHQAAATAGAAVAGGDRPPLGASGSCQPLSSLLLLQFLGCLLGRFRLRARRRKAGGRLLVLQLGSDGGGGALCSSAHVHWAAIVAERRGLPRPERHSVASAARLPATKPTAAAAAVAAGA